jgi:chromosome segregation ATPase
MSAQNASSLLSELKSLVAELRKYQAEVNVVKRSVSVTTALKAKKEQTLKSLESRIASEEKSLDETLSKTYSSMEKFGRDNDSIVEKYSEKLNEIRDNFTNQSRAGQVTKAQESSFNSMVTSVEGALNTIVYGVDGTDLWNQIRDNYADSQAEIEYRQQLYSNYYAELKELLSVKLSKSAEYTKLMEGFEKEESNFAEKLVDLESRRVKAEDELKELNLDSLKKEFASIPGLQSDIKKKFALMEEDRKKIDAEITRLTGLLGDETDEISDEEIQSRILDNQAKDEAVVAEMELLKGESENLDSRQIYLEATIKNFRVVLVNAQSELKGVLLTIEKVKADAQSSKIKAQLTVDNFRSYMTDLQDDVAAIHSKTSDLAKWLEEATRVVRRADQVEESPIGIKKPSREALYKESAIADGTSENETHPYGESWFKFKALQISNIILSDVFKIGEASRLFAVSKNALNRLEGHIALWNRSTATIENDQEKSCGSLYSILVELASLGKSSLEIDARLEEIESLLLQGQDRLVQLDAEVIQYQSDLDGLTLEADQLVIDATQLQDSIDALDLESETYADDLASLTSQLESVNASISVNRDKYSGVETMLSEANSEIIKINDESTALTSEKTTLLDDNLSNKAEYDTVLNRLTDGARDVSSNLSIAKLDLSTSEAGIKSMEEGIESLNKYMSTNPWEMWFNYEEESKEGDEKTAADKATQE